LNPKETRMFRSPRKRFTRAARLLRANRPSWVALLFCACGDDSEPKGYDSPRSEPSSTARGGPCSTGDDCIDSPADHSFKNIRCISELYCLSGRCYAECRERCFPARTDQNPCEDKGLCQPAGTGLPLCTRKAISCTAAESCPSYLPSDAGSAWECVSGVCQFPGYRYQAQ
jgi:hypothetical protein